MAAEPTVAAHTPKQIGRHLRDVRRRKGLSQSEVARGAGLTRRELNAYEKGKVLIPDSDLFVIAGSCGVDVSELRPPATQAALAAPPERPFQGTAGTGPIAASPAGVEPTDPGSTGAGSTGTHELAVRTASGMPSSIEDTVNQLRRGQEQPATAPPPPPAAAVPRGGLRRRRLRALGAGSPMDESGETSAAAWAAATAQQAPDPWVEEIDPFEAVRWPGDAGIADAGGAGSPAPAEPVDVFEELARLPEPGPLPADDGDTDLFTLRDLNGAPPAGMIEDVDDEPYDEWPFDGHFDDDEERAARPEPDPEPVLVEMPQVVAAADITTASDAPPIDVVTRGESLTSPWDALRTPAEPQVFDPRVGAVPAPATVPGVGSPAGGADDDTAAWPGSTPWDPVGPDDGNGYGATHTGASAWDGGVAFDDPDAALEDPALEPSAFEPSAFEPSPSEPTARGRWTHEPDPAATSTGFYVDWGDDGDGPPASTPGSLYAEPVDRGDERSEWDTAAWDREPWPEPEVETFAPGAEPSPWSEAWDPTRGDDEGSWPEPIEPERSVAADDPWAPAPDDEWAPDGEEGVWGLPATYLPIQPDGAVEPSSSEVEELPVISWHPGGDTGAAQVLDVGVTTALVAERESDPEPVPQEDFVVAGSQWELGNAVPLVEVRSTGGLVMRRADERWALADVVAATDFALEAYVDFRSGPGFGVLFRAALDGDGHMSGYSFDVDPVYEGGGYLVREWRADRELWNPIAHVGIEDPASLHGLLAVRITVDDDRLVAAVNGDAVLVVDSLKQASADRGREGASGALVGIQAWSSTDLVIDELRVASH